ncbi:MAG: nuclear transport factor 2 family protein [Cyanobacteria bacterium J06639_18]
MLRSSRRKIIISTLAGLAGISTSISKTQAQTQPSKDSNVNNIRLPENNDINNTQLLPEDKSINNIQKPQNDNTIHSPIQQISDKIEIINTVNKIALMSDLRNWKDVLAEFTDKVEFDYTSLFGGEPIHVPAKLQVKEWEESFAKNFKITQHILGTHTVTLNENLATCISNFQAHHVFLEARKGQSWTLGGTYNHELTRLDGVWKVNKMKMTVNWEEGVRPF